MLTKFFQTPGALTTLCSAILTYSAPYVMLDSLHLALVPVEMKAAIQTQLPQKTFVS